MECNGLGNLSLGRWQLSSGLVRWHHVIQVTQRSVCHHCERQASGKCHLYNCQVIQYSTALICLLQQPSARLPKQTN